MSSNSIGKIFNFTTWGESHGNAIGCVVDGVPSKISLKEENIQSFLDKRRPGQSKYTTQRKEKDEVEILSGVFEGLTTGHPISLIIKNEDQRSKDYSDIETVDDVEEFYEILRHNNYRVIMVDKEIPGLDLRVMLECIEPRDKSALLLFRSFDTIIDDQMRREFDEVLINSADQTYLKLILDNYL